MRKQKLYTIKINNEKIQINPDFFTLSEDKNYIKILGTTNIPEKNKRIKGLFRNAKNIK